MSYWSHLLGHSYPCNAATCPVVTGRQQPDYDQRCDACPLNMEEE